MSRGAKSAFTEADRRTMAEQYCSETENPKEVQCDICDQRVKLAHPFHLHDLINERVVKRKVKKRVENEETGETDLVEVEEETVIVGGHCGVDKHVTAVRNRRAREALDQKEKRQQDIRETFKATKKPKPSVSSSSASSGVSASAAAADADAAPPPQPIPCLGLQWLSAKNPSFFSLEEQGEHFNLVFEYRKAEHLGGAYRETTTEGVLKGVTVLRAKGCTREGTMRSSIPTERVGEDRIEKAGLMPRLSFEWTSCDKCYNACAKTFKSSVFGDKKEFLNKVMNVIRLCDKGAYTYERDLHIIEQKLQSEQTSAAEMRELFRQQSEKRQLHEKEKNLMKEKGWFSANSGPNGNAAKYYDYKSWQTLEKRVEIFRKGIVGAEDRRRLHFIDNDDFLKNFLPLYRSGQLDGTPFLDLSCALVNRHLGWKNAPLGEQGSALIHSLCLAGGVSAGNTLRNHFVGVQKVDWRLLAEAEPVLRGLRRCSEPPPKRKACRICNDGSPRIA